MAKTFKLKRTKQCAKCPWRVDTNPHDIPNGYTEEAHERLAATIADTPLAAFGGGLPMMACHESPEGNESHCIGWLNNQLGVGNNIGLRMAMMRCENIGELELRGEQHERFADTLPQ